MRKQFPSIPASRDKNPTLEKMKELVEIWLGDRGNKLDRVVTYRDLVDSKLGRVTQGGGLAPGDSISEPAPTYVGPLTNLTAVASMNFIILSWSGVNQTDYAYTEIWRSSTDNLGNAVLTGTTPAQVYTDSVGSGVGYYYWVRAISTSGNPGAWNATAGTYAETPLSPDWVIDQITGLISESELASALESRVDLIDAPTTGLVDRMGTAESQIVNIKNVVQDDGTTLTQTFDSLRATVAAVYRQPGEPVGGTYFDGDLWIDSDDGNRLYVYDTGAWVDARDLGITDALGKTKLFYQASAPTAEGVGDLWFDTDDGDKAYRWDGLAWNPIGIATIERVTADIIDNNVTMIGYCLIGGSPDSSYTTPSSCTAAGGSWQAADPLAESVKQVAVTDGNQTAALEQMFQAHGSDLNGLKLEYTLKLDNNGYVSGLGLYNDGTTSEFIVASAAAYFIDPAQSVNAFDPNVNYASLDAARDTQLVFGYAEVAGAKRFVINAPAYIPDATITVAKLESAFVDKLVAAQGVIAAAYIARAGFDQSYFSGDLQSGSVSLDAQGDIDGWDSSYSAGVSGWILRSSGNVEFNDITARGHIEADSGYIASTLQIGGTTKDMSDLLAMESTITDWTRPTTTLIDGNKIFTGDAYVDTLQIKGNAVTVPVMATGSGTPGDDVWSADLASVSYSHGHSSAIPVSFVCHLRETVQVTGTDGSLNTIYPEWQFRLLQDGVEFYKSNFFRDINTAVHHIASFPTGAHQISVQLLATGSSTAPEGTVTINNLILGTRR